MTWIAIDQDQSQDDEVCGVQLGVDLLRNLNDSANERHSGGARHWTAQAAYSTPSEVWRSIPIAVPIYEGARTLNVALRYEAAIGSESAGTDAIEARLVCNGSQGSISTLKVTSSVTSVELSCDVDSPTRTWAWAAIQVRSLRNETEVADLQPNEQVTSGVLKSTVSGSISTGRTHYELVVSRDDQLLAASNRYPALHVTRVIDVGLSNYWLLHWPHVPDGATYDNVETTQNDAAELYELGTITPHGVSWWWSSTDNTYLSIDGWLLQHGPLATVRPSSVQQLDGIARQLLRRPYVWGTGPRGDDGTTAADNGGRKIGYTATGTSDALRIARYMATYDDETRGFRVAMVAGPIGTPIPYGVTLTATVYADDGTSLGTSTLTPRIGPTSGIASVVPMTQVEQPRSSYALYQQLARDPYKHGSGDLVGAEEYRPGTVIGDVSDAASYVIWDVAWPSGITDGDTVYIDITTDTEMHVWSATCVEWR